MSPHPVGDEYRLRIVPCNRDQAFAFIAAWHRHHPPPVANVWAVGVAAGETLVGVATCGRPVRQAVLLAPGNNSSYVSVERLLWVIESGAAFMPPPSIVAAPGIESPDSTLFAVGSDR